MNRIVLSKRAFLLLLVLGIAAFAGNLEPSGPPAGTMKPLDQVEPRTAITSVPFTISTKGSYYLTKNLTATGTAITVSADDVTIDLCGFTLTGPGAGGMNYGISMESRNNVEIRNGVVKNFGIFGIYGYGGTNLRAIGIRSFSNGKGGIYFYSINSLIKDCTVSDNGTGATGVIYGIFINGNSIASGNTIYNNGASALTGSFIHGICAINEGCTITGNVVYANGGLAASGNSVYGISAGSGSIVTGNTVCSNGSFDASTQSGIFASGGSKVADNTVRLNFGVGIKTADNTIISGNAVTNNLGNGIQATARCSISNNQSILNNSYGISMGDNCTAVGNIASSNTNNGINTGLYCSISNCTANSNTQRGIYAGDYSSITNCTASQNSQDGIWGMSYSSITGCNAGNNQKVGIFCWRGKVIANTASNNNQVNDAGGAGIQVWYSSLVRDNMLMDNKQNGLYIHDAGSSIENNTIQGSGAGIYFTNTSGNYYKDNRVNNCTTPWVNAGTNINGGGNVSF